MTKSRKLLAAEHRYNYAVQFPEGSSKHDDYMRLSWFYLLDWAGAPVWGNR